MREEEVKQLRAKETLLRQTKSKIMNQEEDEEGTFDTQAGSRVDNFTMIKRTDSVTRH